jgi:hypothetical protein
LCRENSLLGLAPQTRPLEDNVADADTAEQGLFFAATLTFRIFLFIIAM